MLDDSLPNLIITPHTAWISLEARQRLVEQVAGTVGKFLGRKSTLFVDFLGDLMHLHILGICGTFMGSLALLAKANRV